VFCHYYPGKSNFPNKRFVQNKKWKLYENGEIYHILNDPMEKRSIPPEELDSDQALLISSFKEVLKAMQ